MLCGWLLAVVAGEREAQAGPYQVLKGARFTLQVRKRFAGLINTVWTITLKWQTGSL